MPKMTVVVCDKCGNNYPDTTPTRPKFEESLYYGILVTKEVQLYLCKECAETTTVFEFFRDIVVPYNRALKGKIDA